VSVVFHQSFVRVRAGTKTDRGGNTVPDWSPAATDRITVHQVSVQPTTQTEEASASRTAVVTGWQVISAPGVDVDVRSDDRIEWDGKLLEIVGEVARYLDFVHGSTHHVEFAMRRATG
jgi:hypothetical protein